MSDTGGPEVPAPPWRSRRKTAGPPRRPLSQERIVDAALRVLDAEGLEAVSMRRVAQELGTGPASLYAHVSGKEELLELMLERIAGEMRIPEPDPQRWSEQIREAAREMYRVLSAHADIARASMATIPTGPNAMRLSEALLSIMLAGGVPPQIAAWTIDQIALYVTAHVYEGSLHLAKQRASGKGREQYMADFLGQVRSYFVSLPPDRFPNIVRHVDELMTGGGDDRFEFGLDLLIRGLESYAGARPPAPPPRPADAGTGPADDG
ncbi:MAG: TetR/AcrR family transcriptional regulator C-terminal domain-containing protein [Actinomadura rubrobrunea]|nr:TetR/AcrR family transcriptional regulator C-terminal domain-containing protein [Actinomadura rubrobrunea]